MPGIVMGLPLWLLVVAWSRRRKRDASQDIQRPPAWGFAALILQVLALLAVFLIFNSLGKRGPLLAAIYAVPTYALFALLGLLAAFWALVRNERWPLLSWAALLLNGVPCLSCLRLIL
jgi:peptidoglycan/LPS O-acetylase OafA/YrhL